MQERSSEQYSERIFEAQIGDLPRMGWFAPEHGFLAHEDAAQVNLFAAIGLPSTGRKKGPFSGIKTLRQSYGMVCEIEDTDHLTAFEVDREVEPTRALYITKKVSTDTRAGLVTIPLDATLMAKINRLLAWPEQGALRRDEAIGVRAQSSFYSLHKLYNPKTGLLREEAIVLHRRDGEIVAHELSRDLDLDQPCDGCGIPRYSYPSSGIYRPQNMFELPGFAYPVLLLDTSTVEGQALSLLTFTPSGKVTQFRVYEYTVHCR